jgi:hypothetical protein
MANAKVVAEAPEALLEREEEADGSVASLGRWLLRH